jgi:short-subunit dehydrogenase
MSYVLIIGAKSDIAKACARAYAKNGYDLLLAGRNIDELKDFEKDLTVRTSQNIKLLELDILATEEHNKFYNNLPEKPLGVISAIGLLGDQIQAQEDYSHARAILDTNFTCIISLLNIVANDFEQRKSGFIVGISSVAGDRGRKSNYIYGAAKAGFTAYLSGLRNRLVASHVHVMTVKPGFVATQMTKDMDLPEKLTALPKAVAQHIFQGQQRNKNTIYTKWQWRYIMLIIKAIPEFIFKKLNL